MNIGDIFFALRGEGSGLQVDAKKAAEAAGTTGGRSFSQRFSTQMKAGLGLGAGIGAFGLLTDAARRAGEYMGDAIAGGIAEQAQIASLTGVLAANVKGWDGNTAAIEAGMKARSRLGFLDDDMRASMIRLIPVTRDVNRAFDLQAVAMDVARLKTIPLLDASNLVGLAMSGNTRALKQLGIELKAGATKTEILGEIMRVTAGQAEIFAGTMAGTVARVGNTWKEFQDDVGTGVVDALNQAATGLSYMEWRSKAADQAGGGFLGMMSLIPAVADAAGIGIEDYARHLVFNKAAQEGNTVALTAAGDSMGELGAKYREALAPLNIFATETDEASTATDGLTSALDAARASWDILNGRIKANDEFANLPDKITVAAGEVATAQAELETAITAGNEVAIAAARIRLRDAKSELRDLRTEWTLLQVAMERPITVGETYHPGGKIERRARGGSAYADTPYIVGDGGRPELFVPETDGRILSSVPSGFSGSSGGSPAVIRLEIGGRPLLDYVDENLVYRRRI